MAAVVTPAELVWWQPLLATVINVIGLIAPVIICGGAYFLFVGTSSEVSKNNAISSAARSVGSTADKAGAAIDKNN